MKHKKIKINKLNNDGVSLIELLVAMVILSICVVAFGQGMIIAAKTNSKAKIQHKATSLAQNVLEGLKAEDMAEILGEFTYPSYSDASGAAVDNFNIIQDGFFSQGVIDSVGTFAASGVPYVSLGTDGVNSDYVETSDGKYQLYMEQVAMENTKFDVLVTLDGSAYRSDLTDESGVPTSNGQNFNSEQMAQIPNMDSNYDAVISNSAVYDVEALASLKNSFPGENFEYIDRTMTIDISSTTLLSGEIHDVVTAAYKYEFRDVIYPVSAPDYVFDNSAQYENRLRNIYVFYHPMYGCLDEIVINNPNRLPVEVYLIKLEDTSLGTELSAKENSYRMSVSVSERPVSGPITDTTPCVKIRTNLDYNLANLASKITQAAYEYTDASGIKSVGTDAKNKLKVSELTNATETDKIFDVTIEVFPSAETDFSGKTLNDVRTLLGESAAVMEGSIRN